eukprot:scaffold23233_cov111-Isochrysis_galbana.AAC.5
MNSTQHTHAPHARSLPRAREQVSSRAHTRHLSECWGSTSHGRGHSLVTCRSGQSSSKKRREGMQRPTPTHHNTPSQTSEPGAAARAGVATN